MTGQTRIDVVPCGKCEECLSFKRQEFVALSIHQAMVSGSLYFFTLTYDDKHLPVAISEDQRLVGFQFGCDVWCSSGHFLNQVFQSPDCFHAYACSFRREDVKNWIKQFRVEFERKYNEKPSFKYCFFGELGEHRGRPHYHGLIYGASPKIANMLHDLWCQRFGFAYCVPSDYHSLSLDEIGKVSNYVSKYISKGVSSRFAYLLPYIEKPRRICSQDFGSFSLDEYKQLRDYYDGADLHHLSKDLFLEEVSKRRTSFKINGNSFPIPLRLKQKLFYENGFSDISGNGGNSFSSCKDFSFKQNSKSSVSCMVSAFTRDKHLHLLDRQLRQNPKPDSKQVSDWVIRKTLNAEKSASQSREEIAKQNNLNQLKHCKDGQ